MVSWCNLLLCEILRDIIGYQLAYLTFSCASVMQRWKEQYFVNVGTDCGLTIAGFYYVCFSCSDGSINGFYYDPNSRYNTFALLMPKSPSFLHLPTMKLADECGFAALSRSSSSNLVMKGGLVSAFRHTNCDDRHNEYLESECCSNSPVKRFPKCEFKKYTCRSKGSSPQGSVCNFACMTVWGSVRNVFVWLFCCTSNL